MNVADRVKEHIRMLIMSNAVLRDYMHKLIDIVLDHIEKRRPIKLIELEPFFEILDKKDIALPEYELKKMEEKENLEKSKK